MVYKTGIISGKIATHTQGCCSTTNEMSLLFIFVLGRCQQRFIFDEFEHIRSKLNGMKPCNLWIRVECVRLWNATDCKNTTSTFFFFFTNRLRFIHWPACVNAAAVGFKNKKKKKTRAQSWRVGAAAVGEEELLKSYQLQQVCVCVWVCMSRRLARKSNGKRLLDLPQKEQFQNSSKFKTKF